ncbi:MAG: hypothetical protein V1709_06835 [Planctomycetota bacterium]
MLVRINRWHLAGIAMMVLIMFVVGISITSCGKSSSGSSTLPAATGIAVDPYIIGAQFFEDIDNDAIKDAVEQLSTLSNANGVFTFANQLTLGSTIALNPSVIGTHNGVAFTARIRSRVNSITATQVTSPLTTLLANGWTEIEIINALSNAGLTGLTVSDLTANPMEGIGNLDSTTLTEAHLLRIRACMCVCSFMTVMNTLIAGEGYDITPISITGTAGATQSLANMVMTVNTALSTGLLTTLQVSMNAITGTPGSMPKVTAGDVIRSAVAISNYIIPKVAADPSTFVPNLAEINSLGQQLGLNFYTIRNKGNASVQYAYANSLMSGVLPGITAFNTFTVNSSGVVVGQ